MAHTLVALLCLQGVKFLQDCEYIAIFDADFKPEPDFLLRTVPYLVRTHFCNTNLSASLRVCDELKQVLAVNLTKHLG